MKNANIAIFVPHMGCPHACSFCNQREISGQCTPPAPEEVKETVGSALEAMGSGAQNAEIAFFGGSFTAIEPELMVSLLGAVHEFIGPGGFKGIRVSTRPDAIDDGILKTLKDYGVTAIELGAQSMDASVLELNQRGHTPADVAAASRLIKAGGFELGLQMMTGLYGSNAKLDYNTARALAALEPDTVRIYPTIVMEGTELARLYKSGRYIPPGLEETIKLCAELLKFFYNKNIAVIRLGLHSQKSLEEGYVAGPWHPAFRELCESAVYLEKAQSLLKDTGKSLSKITGLYVAQSEISKLAGQHRSNIILLEQEFGTRIKIRARVLPKYVVEAGPLL